MANETKGGGFATLADQWRAALIKPDRIALPVDQLFGFARKELNAQCQNLLRPMDRAHRIVLNDDFTMLAAQFSCTPPSVLLEAYKVVVMPFDTLWIEWNDRVRNQTVTKAPSASDAPDRLGMLIYPYMLSKDEEDKGRVVSYDVNVITGYSGNRVAPSSVGFVFSLDETRLNNRDPLVPPVSDLAIMDKDRIKHVNVNPLITLGQDYCSKVKKEDLGTAIGLSVRATPVLALPFGPMHTDAIERHGINTKAAKRQIQWLEGCLTEEDGNWRWLLSVLALLSYKPDSGAIGYSTGARGKTQFVKGKFLPAYEYRVVSLAKPAEKVLARRIQQFTAAAAHRRWHTVNGHWAYSHKLGDPTCDHAWLARLDDEGKQRGSKQQVCAKCGRVRWHKHAHGRGDRSLGIIDKGYEIKTSGPREHRVERVVENLK